MSVHTHEVDDFAPFQKLPYRLIVLKIFKASRTSHLWVKLAKDAATGTNAPDLLSYNRKSASETQKVSKVTYLRSRKKGPES